MLNYIIDKMCILFEDKKYIAFEINDEQMVCIESSEWRPFSVSVVIHQQTHLVMQCCHLLRE